MWDFNPTWISQFHMPAFFVVSGLLFIDNKIMDSPICSFCYDMFYSRFL